MRLPALTEGDETLRDARELYPTVEGGRYFAALLDSTEESDDLVQHLRPIGRQAVQTYQGALKELVEFDATMDLVVPAYDAEGQPIRRKVSVPVQRSQKGLKVLNRKPKETSQSLEVEGCSIRRTP